MRTRRCGACDVCLDEGEVDEEATLVAQKILSCVARVEERFGVGHVVKVLTGSNDKLVRSFGHDQLSTFGLLRDLDAQEADQPRLSARRPGSARPHARRPAAAEAQRRLLGSVARRAARAAGHAPAAGGEGERRLQAESWAGVDRALFESLRELRRTIAAERGVPAYVIFRDATLRDMARRRPQTPAEFLTSMASASGS